MVSFRSSSPAISIPVMLMLKLVDFLVNFAPRLCHKLWEWRYCQEEDVLIHVGVEEMRVYTLQQEGTRRSRHKKYCESNLMATYLPKSMICSVKLQSPDCFSIISTTAPPQQTRLHFKIS
jgi:hypothetical protein